MALPLLSAGCAFLQPRATRISPPLYRHASRYDLQERLESRATSVRSLKAHFTVVTRNRGGRGGTRCGGMLAISPPGKLRMKGSSAMLPTLFDLICNGETTTLYIPREKTAYRGVMNTATPREGLPSPAALIDILMGGLNHQRYRYFVEEAETEYTLYEIECAESRAGPVRKIVFSRLDLNPVRYVYFDELGRPTLKAACKEFTPSQGRRAAIPRRVTLDQKGAGNVVILHLDDVKLNEELHEGLFQLDLPPHVTLLPIDEM